MASQSPFLSRSTDSQPCSAGSEERTRFGVPGDGAYMSLTVLVAATRSTKVAWLRYQWNGGKSLLHQVLVRTAMLRTSDSFFPPAISIAHLILRKQNRSSLHTARTCLRPNTTYISFLMKRCVTQRLLLGVELGTLHHRVNYLPTYSIECTVEFREKDIVEFY